MRTKNFLKILAITLLLLIMGKSALAENDLAKKLSGRILIQVESHGQAWYVNPLNLKRYYLGRPLDAFNIMRGLGIGITNNDLMKIPVRGSAEIDTAFSKLHAGKIFLQVQDLGQAWYVNPLDYKRYYLGRPDNAFTLMNEFGLGINNANLNKITVGYLNIQVPPVNPPVNPPPVTPPADPGVDAANQVMSGAAQALRQGDKNGAADYFTNNMKLGVEYTINSLDADGRLTLGNILSDAALSSSSASEKTYLAEIYFPLGGYKVPLYFHVQKQADGKWLLKNL